MVLTGSPCFPSGSGRRDGISNRLPVIGPTPTIEVQAGSPDSKKWKIWTATHLYAEPCSSQLAKHHISQNVELLWLFFFSVRVKKKGRNVNVLMFGGFRNVLDTIFSTIREPSNFGVLTQTEKWANCELVLVATVQPIWGPLPSDRSGFMGDGHRAFTSQDSQKPSGHCDKVGTGESGTRLKNHLTWDCHLKN